MDLKSPAKYGVLGLIVLGLFSLSTIKTFANELSSFDCQELIAKGWLRLGQSQKMPGGRFKGLPLSASTPSPALQVLNMEHMNILAHPVPEQHWYVGNFLSRHGIALAAIPKVPPKRVSILKEEEVDGTLHLVLRILYHKSITVKFWPQSMDGILDVPFETSDIVIEFGTHRAEGQERRDYTALRGMIGHYALQARMGTTWFKVRRVQRDGRKITELRLDVPKALKLKMVEQFLARTSEINQGEMYNSLNKNCATETYLLFQTIGLVNCAELGAFGELIHSAVSWVPQGLLWSLKKRQVGIARKENEIQIQLKNRN